MNQDNAEDQSVVALATAATAAGYAPSVHNTQPWRWRILADRLELFADRSRQLTAADPPGHLLLISCGAALHHARVALAAQGWTAETDRLPNPAQPDLLAQVRLTGRTPVTAEARRLARTTRVRHTDRRPVSDQTVPADALRAIGKAVSTDARIQLLSDDQILELAAAASRAGATEGADPGTREELEYWTGRNRPAGAGLPAEVLPEREPETTVPGRDFGRPGTLPIGPGHDRTAVYAVLYGDGDDPRDWLRAGEALSAGWLRATELGVSVVPLSGVIEVASTRQTLRVLLAGLGHPYLVLRLGIAAPEHAGPPHTPRLPTAQVIDTLDA
ncbi:nitroreductase [Plantactinospora sp. S1510]|uniref:Nitroreductase n=1 Tax=Plantactinospora alkalitolerans TaxID=2789879 RepID=A0ABS0GYQ6_9ACTN|nr:nitroreductase [Plantactinospora alkalitolerans]MBF9131310.1 nitroreductase [Plantactinospora alkalitolerans]